LPGEHEGLEGFADPEAETLPGTPEIPNVAVTGPDAVASGPIENSGSNGSKTGDGTTCGGSQEKDPLAAMGCPNIPPLPS